jgi:hypothetical protein
MEPLRFGVEDNPTPPPRWGIEKGLEIGYLILGNDPESLIPDPQCLFTPSPPEQRDE